jgi:hypothetical protein
MKFAVALILSLLSVLATAEDAIASSAPSNDTAVPISLPVQDEEDADATEPPMGEVEGTDNWAPSAAPTLILAATEVPQEEVETVQDEEPTEEPVEEEEEDEETAAPTTAEPTTAAPTTVAPASAQPTTASPLSASPISASPVSASPVEVAAIPTSSAPSTAAPFVAEVVEDDEDGEEDGEEDFVFETGSPAIAPQEPQEEVFVTDPDDAVLPSDIPSSMPSASPIFAQAETTFARDASCSATPACSGLSLEGDCCPTTENWTLACCGGPDIPVEVSCASNNKCAELGLEGACCPTMDGDNSAYLDCCTVLPDECIDASTCEVKSAVEYKLEMESRTRSAASASRLSGFAAVAALVLAAIL